MEYILRLCSCCKEHYDRKSLVLYRNENMSDVLLRCILSYLFELPIFKFWLTCLKNLILVWAIWWTAWQDWAGFLLNNFIAICSDNKNSLLDINKLRLIKEFNIYNWLIQKKRFNIININRCTIWEHRLLKNTKVVFIFVPRECFLFAIHSYGKCNTLKFHFLLMTMQILFIYGTIFQQCK